MVSAYSAFPNKGVRHEKHLIRRVLDRDGNTARRVGEDDLQGDERIRRAHHGRDDARRHVGRRHRAGGVRGRRARSRARPAPSTTTPTCGLSATRRPTSPASGWAIRNASSRSARGMTGGRGALPIWLDFMKDFLKDKPKENSRSRRRCPKTSANCTSNASARWPRSVKPIYAAGAPQSEAETTRRCPPRPPSRSSNRSRCRPRPARRCRRFVHGAPPAADTAPKKPEPSRRAKTPAPPPPAALTRPREVEPAKEERQEGFGRT